MADEKKSLGGFDDLNNKESTTREIQQIVISKHHSDFLDPDKEVSDEPIGESTKRILEERMRNIVKDSHSKK
jgi:hypothetical protein